MHLILGIFLVIIFVLFFIGISILNTVLRIFGFGRRRTPNPQYKNQRNSQQQTHTSTSSSSQKKKVFDSNEGEYVDYEEVE